MKLPHSWRLKDSRYRLEGNQCTACEESFFPARSLCPSCRNTRLDTRYFSGLGKIYSYTAVYQRREEASLNPVLVAMIKLDEGPMLTAQLTDAEPDEISIDQPVEMVTRLLHEAEEDQLLSYGYKFRPLL